MFLSAVLVLLLLGSLLPSANSQASKLIRGIYNSCYTKLVTQLASQLATCYDFVGVPIGVDPNEGDLRLIDNLGQIARQFGRLEIYRNGVWGTVCIDGFDFYEGDIACRQLGFPYANGVDTVIEFK